MSATAGKRLIPRAAFDALQSELASLRAQLSAALEDADDIMRGWSDIAEKASFSASTEPIRRRIALLERDLATVFPADAAENQDRVHPDSDLSIDELILRAMAAADRFRVEIRDGGKTKEIDLPDAPFDPAEFAAGLRAAGMTGELRVVAGELGSPEEQCVAIYLLAELPRTAGDT